MKNSSKSTAKEYADKSKSDPYLTLVNSRVKNLNLESENTEFLLCKKSFVRLLKTKLSGEADNEFIEGFEKYTFGLGNIIDTLKNHLEYSQKRIQNKDTEIENLISRLRYMDSLKDQRIALSEKILELTQERLDRRDREIESLSEEMTLLKANPDRRKGGTTAYFGKLCIEKN